MDQDLNNKTNFKEKTTLFLKENKLKVFLSIFVVLSIMVFLVFLKINNEKKKIIKQQNNSFKQEYFFPQIIWKNLKKFMKILY